MDLINARSEGKNNQANDPKYSGTKGIILMPAFRKPIRSQRCLVIADAFYEGPEEEKLSKPYLIYLRDKQRPFAFAGIWDTWRDEEGIEFNTFAIITTTANKLMQKIGHHRTPIILKPNQEAHWLRTTTPLSDITSMLYPYNSELMNAYPVSTEVKNPKNDTRELIAPIGERLFPKNQIITQEDLKKLGFGRRFKKEPTSTTTMAERAALNKKNKT